MQNIASEKGFQMIVIEKWRLSKVKAISIAKLELGRVYNG